MIEDDLRHTAAEAELDLETLKQRCNGLADAYNVESDGVKAFLLMEAHQGFREALLRLERAERVETAAVGLLGQRWLDDALSSAAGAAAPAIGMSAGDAGALAVHRYGGALRQLAEVQSTGQPEGGAAAPAEEGDGG